jgi:hypothetical protein
MGQSLLEKTSEFEWVTKISKSERCHCRLFAVCRKARRGRDKRSGLAIPAVCDGWRWASIAAGLLRSQGMPAIGDATAGTCPENRLGTESVTVLLSETWRCYRSAMAAKIFAPRASM